MLAGPPAKKQTQPFPPEGGPDPGVLACALCTAQANVSPDPVDTRNGFIEWANYKLDRKKNQIKEHPRDDLCCYCMRIQMRMRRKTPAQILRDPALFEDFNDKRAEYIAVMRRYNVQPKQTKLRCGSQLCEHSHHPCAELHPEPHEEDDFAAEVRYARAGLDRMFIGENFATDFQGSAASSQGSNFGNWNDRTGPYWE